MVQLAREHGLILHAHVDAEAVRRLFAQDPGARILWAHAGFEDAVTVRGLMERHDNLWADLSFRYGIHVNAKFQPGWRELLVDHADRFMVGIDTYTPGRWDEIGALLAWYDELFAALPDDVAAQIRYRNAERVIGNRFEPAARPATR